MAVKISQTSDEMKKYRLEVSADGKERENDAEDLVEDYHVNRSKNVILYSNEPQFIPFILEYPCKKEETFVIRLISEANIYTATATIDEELTIYAKTNAPEGEALPIKLEIFMKGSSETKIVELEEYVENMEINRVLTLEEIASQGSVDANDIKEVQASIVYKEKEYKSNKTKTRRTLKAKLWTGDGTLNDVVEDKKKESYKKGKNGKPNSKGEEVKLIQTALQKMNINIGNDGVDGVFGNDGHNAVMTFQENFKPTHNTHQYDWGEPDGIVGKNTLLAMDEALVQGWKYEKSKDIWDNDTEKNISTLHPNIRENVTLFILEAQAKEIYLFLYSAYRSIDEQNTLYLQGRKKVNDKYIKIGDTVTNAKGSESYHNFGLAFDLVEKKDGKALWENDWNEITKIAKKHGFEWGGDWKSFKDKPHFQMTFGYSTKDLYKKVLVNDMENGYVKL